MKKTGNTIRMIAVGWALVFAIAAHAADIEFTAKVDRSQISVDESVSLKLTVQSEGGASAGQPQFTAPDFEVVNEYSGTYVESYYDGNSGRFGMRNNQQITKVLKPSKVGTLRISGISVNVSGKNYKAPDIQVQVAGSGAGTPPPRGYGGGGIGLRGAGKQTSGPSVKVRAEVDKDHVYKGEQVIVSYYLYRRVRVFNIQVDKFPVLSGFLREDLDMPVLGQRLDTERVVLDGVPYERSLLLRYAAYPLQEGKLKIDSTALKYAYYPNTRQGSLDDEDPFMGFFHQMTPQQGADRSEQLTVDVLPLPEEGKPNSFTGGVGDFNISSAVDKYEVHANEAVTLTLKVEGRGNVAAIGEPKAKWPENVELYDAKGVAKAGHAGVGEKVFEFLLIPRAPGKVVLPPLEFSFFDPAKKAYVTRTTEPFTINVTEPAPGSAPSGGIRAKSSPSGDLVTQNGTKTEEVQGLKTPEAAETGKVNIPAWRWLYWICSVMFLGLIGLLVYDGIRKTKARSDAQAATRAKAHARSWEKLHEGARQAGMGASWIEVVQTYELLAGVIFEAIDQAYAVEARSRPRSQLKEILVGEFGLSEDVWNQISKLLEFAEMVRFASSVGAVSEKAARTDLARWVSDGEAVSRTLQNVKRS
jgi:hypothetical protein